jgi:hypothetical protein
MHLDPFDVTKSLCARSDSVDDCLLGVGCLCLHEHGCMDNSLVEQIKQVISGLTAPDGDLFSNVTAPKPEARSAFSASATFANQKGGGAGGRSTSIVPCLLIAVTSRPIMSQPSSGGSQAV